MSGKELMIGDWVQIVEPCKYAGAIGRIKTLIDHKDDENAYFKVFLQNNTIHIGIEDICSEDIRPIPLEKIHLTKNGFEAREETDDTEFYYYDCYEINVSFDEGISEENIPPIIFLTIEFAEKSIAMPIDYVHQLQHALKLCGIDKEIEL
jgi:hypothetical protein